MCHVKEPISAKFELYVDISNCRFTGYEIVSTSVSTIVSTIVSTNVSTTVVLLLIAAKT